MDPETMDVISSEERREFPRLDARVKVDLVFMPPGSREATSREFRSMDVSSGGMRILIDTPVSKGSFVALRVRLPEEKETVDLFAKVVWQRPASQKTEQYLVGLKFLSSSQESVETLKKFLQPRL